MLNMSYFGEYAAKIPQISEMPKENGIFLLYFRVGQECHGLVGCGLLIIPKLDFHNNKLYHSINCFAIRLLVLCQCCS